MTILGNVSFCREFLPLSSPNEINCMIIYLFSQKNYSFTAVLNLIYTPGSKQTTQL